MQHPHQIQNPTPEALGASPEPSRQPYRTPLLVSYGQFQCITGQSGIVGSNVDCTDPANFDNPQCQT